MVSEKIDVLDHGFVRLVDTMGDDSAIVQAARVSYGAGTKSLREDTGLINYLVRNKHTSPLEMVEFKFHIKMPIFIARQWIRHRTASVNEYSARYSIMEKEFYIPTPEVLAAQSTKNHQGRDSEPLNKEEVENVLAVLRDDSEMCYKHYEELMNIGNDPSKKGIARELARMNLPVNIYTQWYWKIDLHNLLHFLNLRQDSHAQYEIRVFADAIANFVKQVCPIAFDAFERHIRNAVSFNSDEFKILAQLIGGESDVDEGSLTGTALSEFKLKLDKITQ